MFSMFRKPKAPETGRANAHRFAAAVTQLAAEERMVVMYPHPGWRGSTHTRYDWPWMINEHWRALVLELLADAPVKAATFHAPDSLDGWTFSAVSTVPVPRVAQLGLEDTL